MRGFARTELGVDETTILRFRHLLDEHQLTAVIFDAVKSCSRQSAPAGAHRHDRPCGHHRGSEFHQERQ
jgi:hypothetical protein